MKKNNKVLTPEGQKSLETLRGEMRERHHMSDQDFEAFISYSHNRKLTSRVLEMRKYKIFAEVIKSKYCAAGIKEGQKYVFSNVPSMLLVEESDCPLCIKALGPMGHVMTGFWDRFIEGDNINGGMWEYAQCLDPGIERGGLGNVLFRVYAKKIA